MNNNTGETQFTFGACVFLSWMISGTVTIVLGIIAVETNQTIKDNVSVAALAFGIFTALCCALHVRENYKEQNEFNTTAAGFMQVPQNNPTEEVELDSSYHWSRRLKISQSA